MPEMACNRYQGGREKPALQSVASECTDLHENLVEAGGFEPKIVSAEPAKTCALPHEQRGAKSGALAPDSGPAGTVSAPPSLPASADSPPGEANGPPDVADLARRLAALPESVRAKLVAMVKADERGKR